MLCLLSWHGSHIDDKILHLLLKRFTDLYCRYALLTKFVFIGNIRVFCRYTGFQFLTNFGLKNFTLKLQQAV
jgi:hypothetical protein